MAEVQRATGERGKRERLIDGAQRVIYEQGVARTTLADVAEHAKVPVGNVYYYFKTKDQLVEAAIEARAREVQEMLELAARHRTPRARLRALVRGLAGQRDDIARRGCPVGTLCSELDKRDDRLARRARDVLALPIDWAERQFRDLGRSDARDLAVALIASYQGISLIANAFRDPALMLREARRLERWIDSLG
jgi:TetR/AcrR family transcriptional regulator, transcriptional repressor for nem operon